MICESPEMKRVMDIALKAAKSNAPILLVGETGVGKEIIGDFIHQNSNRKNNPIVKINCASIPKELVESELFGNVKGAFTGAIMSREGLFKHAEGGTLLFDEIGELSTTCQAKLLRVLQGGDYRKVGSILEQKADCRIISATNINIEESLKNNKLRNDLLHRLSVITINIPKLKDRKEDIPAFISYFIEKYSKEEKKEGISISQDALEYLKTREWKGNVRELENEIRKAIILADDRILNKKQFSLLNDYSLDFKGFSNMELAEKDVIVNALKMYNGNKKRAAKYIGIARYTLRRRMIEYKII